MNVLHTIESYNDFTGGARATGAISEELARRGHRVVVATGGAHRGRETINGVSVEYFPISGNLTRGIQGAPEDIHAYLKLIADNKFDVVLNYAAQSWTTDLAFSALDHSKAKKIIVPCGYSKLTNPKYSGYFAHLPEYLKKYDHVVYLSGNYQDKKFGDAHGINTEGKFSIIPNCADEREFSRQPQNDFWAAHGVREHYVVLGVSNHAFAKRHEWFWVTALRVRRADTAFVLIGKPGPDLLKTCAAPCKIAAMAIPRAYVFKNMNRDDVVSVMRSSSILLHPSRTECDPIVMYEAFAAKLPIVASPVGSMPEFSEYLSIARDPRVMAARINQLLDDEPLRVRYASRGYDLWKNNYTLAKMIDKYESLYRFLLGSSPRAT